jgi:hypothetical protein
MVSENDEGMRVGHKFQADFGLNNWANNLFGRFRGSMRRRRVGPTRTGGEKVAVTINELLCIYEE